MPVVREALVHHMPTRRLSAVDRGEGMTETGRVRTVTPKRTLFLVAVCVNQREQVARRLRNHTVPPSAGLDALEKPVASGEPDDIAGAEEHVRGVPMNTFVAGSAVGDDLVLEDAHCPIPDAREDA
jgi:hypothetical protein